MGGSLSGVMSGAEASCIVLLLANPALIDTPLGENTLHETIKSHTDIAEAVSQLIATDSEDQLITSIYLCLHQSPPIRQFGVKLFTILLNEKKVTLNAIYEAFHTINELLKLERIPTAENATFIKSSFESFWSGLAVVFKTVPKEFLKSIHKEYPSILAQIVFQLHNFQQIDSSILRYILQTFQEMIDHKLGCKIWEKYPHKDLFTLLFRILSNNEDVAVRHEALKTANILLKYTQKPNDYRQYLEKALAVFCSLYNKTNVDKQKIIICNAIQLVISTCYALEDFNQRNVFKQAMVEDWLNIIMQPLHIKDTQVTLEEILKKETEEFRNFMLKGKEKQTEEQVRRFHENWLPGLWPRVLKERRFRKILVQLLPTFLRLLPWRSEGQPRIQMMEYNAVYLWETIMEDQSGIETLKGKIIYFAWSPSGQVRQVVEKTAKNFRYSYVRDFVFDFQRKHPDEFETEFRYCIEIQQREATHPENIFSELFLLASSDFVQSRSISVEALKSLWKLVVTLITHCHPINMYQHISIFTCGGLLLHIFKDDQKLFNSSLLENSLRWAPSGPLVSVDYKRAYYQWMKELLEGFTRNNRSFKLEVLQVFDRWTKERAPELTQYNLSNTLLEILHSSNFVSHHSVPELPPSRFIPINSLHLSQHNIPMGHAHSSHMNMQPRNSYDYTAARPDCGFTTKYFSATGQQPPPVHQPTLMSFKHERRTKGGLLPDRPPSRSSRGSTNW